MILQYADTFVQYLFHYITELERLITDYSREYFLNSGNQNKTFYITDDGLPNLPNALSVTGSQVNILRPRPHYYRTQILQLTLD